MKFNVLTLFPEVFSPYLSVSVLGHAAEKGLIESEIVDIRDFTTDKHKTVDDTPYGGGPGMIMKIEPIHSALASLGHSQPGSRTNRTVVLAARGEAFTQQTAHELASFDELTLICGRYEGIDQRVADNLADTELSIGPYVLAGGELGALVVIEAVARLIPGVLGNPESLTEESYGVNLPHTDKNTEKKQVEYPQYTNPADYNGWKVPDVLLSGNHSAISDWRKKQS